MSTNQLPARLEAIADQQAAHPWNCFVKYRDTKTFRTGLFGLDKLKDPTKTAYTLRTSLDQAVPDEVVKNLSGYIRSDASLKKALK